MHGYKVLSKDGLKGPFKKSSILKAITSAMLPLQARLLDLQTGRYVMAAELVGEQIDTHHAQPKPEKMTRADRPAVKEAVKQMANQQLKLDEETPGQVEETPRVILRDKIPLKRVKLPKPRKLAEKAPEELKLNNPAA
ncbi:MAG: hypothetical protein KDB90_13445 [Planctomycetes bacterium]|nr:hypothetical protein [Planctomycetota bacterium]